MIFFLNFRSKNIIKDSCNTETNKRKRKITSSENQNDVRIQNFVIYKLN